MFEIAPTAPAAAEGGPPMLGIEVGAEEVGARANGLGCGKGSCTGVALPRQTGGNALTSKRPNVKAGP